MHPLEQSLSERVATNLNVALVIAALVGATVVAKRSVASGRADTRGAWRVGGALFALSLVGWACTAHHHGGLQVEFQSFLQGVAGGLLIAALCCVLYLGLGPIVRQRLPHALLGWSRLVAGRFRDPLVARDVLFGLAAFGVVNLVIAISRTALAWFDASARAIELSNFGGTLGLLAFVGQITSSSVSVLLSPMLILLLLTILELLLHSQLAARVLCFVLLGIIVTGVRLAAMPPFAAVFVAFFAVGMLIFVVTKFGLLALMAMTLPSTLLTNSAELTLDTGRWFFGYSAAAVRPLIVVLALAAGRFALGAPARFAAERG